MGALDLSSHGQHKATLFLERTSGRKGHEMIKAIPILAALALLLGCTGCTKVRRDEFPGTYCLSVRDGVETFEVLPDGTYKLTYRIRGEIQFINTGTWEFEDKFHNGELSMSFTNFITGYQHASARSLERVKEELSRPRTHVGYTLFNAERTVFGDIILPSDLDLYISYKKTAGDQCE